MSTHAPPMLSLDRQLRLHHLRLGKLRTWRDAVVQTLCSRESDKVPRCKTMDTTPSTETLQYERDMLDREIRAHEFLIALGDDQQALDVLERIVGDPALAREAAVDPRAFAAARGVQLPRGMAVRVEVIADHVSVDLEYVDQFCAVSLRLP